MKKLYGVAAKLAGMKRSAMGMATVAVLAGCAFAMAPAAHAQFGIGVQIGGVGGYYAPAPVTVYGGGYGYGVPAYGYYAGGYAPYAAGYRWGDGDGDGWRGRWGWGGDDDHRGWGWGGDDHRGWGGDDHRGWGGDHGGWGRGGGDRGRR